MGFSSTTASVDDEMIFSVKTMKLDGDEVPPWTPLPQAEEWPALDRMLQSGVLIDVPDKLLSQSIRRRAKAKAKGQKV